LPAIESSELGDVTIRTIVLGCVSTLMLVGCAHENNAPPSGADPSAPPAQGVAVGEPNLATPPGADATPTPPPADPDQPPVDGAATLTSPATAIAGANVAVAWTGPNNTADYIDLVKKGSTATSGELSYFYLANAPDLTAPAEAGEYEVRYILDSPGGKFVFARIPLMVG